MSGPLIGEVPVLDPGGELGSDLRTDDVRAVVADLLRLANDVERSGVGLIEDPIVFLGEAGLGWLAGHFEPLVRLIEQVSGDPVRLESAAHAWRSMATPVREVGHESYAVVRSRTTDWRGAAADACRAHFARFETASDQVGDECVGLADLLESSAKMMTARAAVSPSFRAAALAGTSWVVAQASAGVTAGASEAASGRSAGPDPGRLLERRVESGPRPRAYRGYGGRGQGRRSDPSPARLTRALTEAQEPKRIDLGKRSIACQTDAMAATVVMRTRGAGDSARRTPRSARGRVHDGRAARRASGTVARAREANACSRRSSSSSAVRPERGPEPLPAAVRRGFGTLREGRRRCGLGAGGRRGLPEW